MLCCYTLSKFEVGPKMSWLSSSFSAFLSINFSKEVAKNSFSCRKSHFSSSRVLTWYNLLITGRHLFNWRTHYMKMVKRSYMEWSGGSCVLWLPGATELVRWVIWCLERVTKPKHLVFWSIIYWTVKSSCRCSGSNGVKWSTTYFDSMKAVHHKAVNKSIHQWFKWLFSAINSHLPL